MAYLPELANGFKLVVRKSNRSSNVIIGWEIPACNYGHTFCCGSAALP